MQYNPDDATERCFPAGEYEAVLESVEDAISQKGNQMQKLTWKVYHPEGRSIMVWDYVTNPGGLYKLKQLATCWGKEDDFNAGAFQADDYVTCTVMAKLGIDAQEGFPDKNKIISYKKLVRKALPAKNTVSGAVDRGRQAAQRGLAAAATAKANREPDDGMLASHPNDNDIPF